MTSETIVRKYRANVAIEFDGGGGRLALGERWDRCDAEQEATDGCDRCGGVASCIGHRVHADQQLSEVMDRTFGDGKGRLPYSNRFAIVERRVGHVASQGCRMHEHFLSRKGAVGDTMCSSESPSNGSPEF